jgi:hypothetical protein
MPPNTASLSLAYHYERQQESNLQVANGHFTARQETNIIDLGLVDATGVQVGASGSDKSEIYLDESHATPGYTPSPLVPGEWQIIVGAYHVAPEGVTVTYELTFTPKHRVLLKGDLHAHTLASDGVLSAEELAWHARRHGLDFLAITDHNQMITRAALPQVPGLTLIPGLEWTHFRGHANFLGVEKPYDAPFFANSQVEIRARFDSARQRGALITLNHPFDPGCEFQFDMDSLPYDCLEVWNGPMRESNLKAIGLWQSLLSAGKKVPICGGSDYHHDGLFQFLGGPTTCVYAMSPNQSDILAALRQGHAYITFAPDGPSLEVSAGPAGASLGDTVFWPAIQELDINAGGLLAGDVVRVVTGQQATPILEAPFPGSLHTRYRMESPGFARIEILRAFLPGLPPLPALISNPVYFEEVGSETHHYLFLNSARQIEGHRLPDQILHARFIDTIAFAEVDGTRGLRLQAGIE